MGQSRKRWLERMEYDPLDPAKQHKPETAADLVSGYLDARLARGANKTLQALTIWRNIAGKRASKHTVAVWLSDPAGPRNLPDLVVYLDGNALMVDLSTNAELYVDRLAHAGLEVAHVRFKLSRKAGQIAQQRMAAAEGPADEPPELPALTPYERTRIAADVERIPASMREDVSKAMEMSLRRAKVAPTREAKSAPQNP